MELRSPAIPRLMSVDALRGTVMIIMAIDHVRDFFDQYSMSFSPTDLSHTTPIMFFTRWITHFCMPVFMFCAGIGAYLWWQRGGHTKRELSWFLASRGVWFVFLELIVMNFAYNFNVSSQNLVLLLVLYIFGACMLLMAALIHLPLRLLAIFSLLVITLHNLLDRFRAAQFGKADWAWHIVHQPGVITGGDRNLLVIYPLLPWIGVMAGGFCFATVFALEAAKRRSVMLKLGVALTVAFLIVRAVNLYGDPSLWSVQHSMAYTVISFLNCTKYPASLDYVLMTIGPALILLSFYERWKFSVNNPLIVFGRVPLFYFVLHFYAIHAILVVMSWIRYGPGAFAFIFHSNPSMGGPREVYPADFGYPLWVTYAVWVGLVAALYPLCRWFASVKATHKTWWLSYL